MLLRVIKSIDFWWLLYIFPVAQIQAIESLNARFFCLLCVWKIKYNSIASFFDEFSTYTNLIFFCHWLFICIQWFMVIMVAIEFLFYVQKFMEKTTLWKPRNTDVAFQFSCFRFNFFNAFTACDPIVWICWCLMVRWTIAWFSECNVRLIMVIKSR